MSDDLLERLDRGVLHCGLHDDNETELFEVDDANDIMAEAKAEIERLREEVAQVVTGRFIAAENAIEAAAAEERAKIVAWLRDDADEVLNADGPVYGADLIAEAIVECAQAIAEGEHLK